MICANILLKKDAEDESKEINENFIEENSVGGRTLKWGAEPLN